MDHGNVTPNRRWYAFSQTLNRLDPEGLKKVIHCKGHRTHLARVALLHRGIGEELDKHGAPLRVYLFVAYAPGRPGAPREVAQQTRFRAVLELHGQRGCWPLPPGLSILGIKVDEMLGHVRPPPAPSGKTSGAKAPSAVEVNADARAESSQMDALRAQHPEFAAILDQVALERRQAT
jgi:hypothetical protein